ncbi:uncharacterized protein LOC108158516 [Drosophila miranda]|uniref:uncharacterized protein LOC108158516 n=1 Tax=Drosophila miranda TaxID=7229 RepID=UPI0007E6445E|nr:uncharacterized protein LOC108158516 [Drosophila miranda]
MSKVAKRDRALIGLHDVLLSSMRSFNCVSNFYDPELNGCFKDTVVCCMSTLHLRAPPRAETVFDTPLLRELGSMVKILITYVSSTMPNLWMALLLWYGPRMMSSSNKKRICWTLSWLATTIAAIIAPRSSRNQTGTTRSYM